jgi:hypothetical protein
MNILSYRTNNENGLSFELLVDDTPLAELIEAPCKAIPFWLFKRDTVELPIADEAGECIVAVCSCGEYGCGRAACRVVREQGTVIFRDFYGDTRTPGRNKSFIFSTENYEAVLQSVACDAEAYECRNNRDNTRFEISRNSDVDWKLPQGWSINPDRPELQCALGAMRVWSNSSQLAQFALRKVGYGNTDFGHGVTYPAELDECDREVEGRNIPDGYVQVYSFFGPPDGEQHCIPEAVYVEMLRQFLACRGLSAEAEQLR